jgi:DNA-binding MarR family transcriptional regulator
MSSRLSDLQKTILVLCLEKRFLTCQDILRQAFVGRNYNVAHASLSRSLTRLWGRGLIRYWRTLSHYSTAITLTPEGERLSKAIKAEQEEAVVDG